MADTYLITGGGGNLACQLSWELAERGDRVVLLDIAERPVGRVSEGCEYLRCDLTDAAAVAAAVREHCPAAVLHFASLLSAQSEADRELAWRVNVDATFQLFETCLRENVRRVFFPSSVASFGAPLPHPVPEDFPQWPRGLYGVTKVAIERLGVYYHARHGLDFRSLRVPIVLSAFAHQGAASAYASMAFIEAARRGQYTFRVRPETRAVLIYAKDVLRATRLLLDAPADKLTRRVYNLQGLSPTAAEIAQVIAVRLPTADLRFAPDPRVADLIDSWPQEFEDHAARDDWGWQPRYDLETLADDFLAELRGSTGQ